MLCVVETKALIFSALGYMLLVQSYDMEDSCLFLVLIHSLFLLSITLLNFTNVVLESRDVISVFAPVISLLTFSSLNENLTLLVINRLDSVYLYSLTGKRLRILHHIGTLQSSLFLFYLFFNLLRVSKCPWFAFEIFWWGAHSYSYHLFSCSACYMSCKLFCLEPDRMLYHHKFYGHLVILLALFHPPFLIN